MSNKFFNAEEMLESGVSAVKKQMNVKAVTQTASSQVMGDTAPVSENQLHGNTQQQSVQDPNTKDFINDLYGTSNTQNNPQAGAGGALNTPADKIPQSPEEAEKLAKARKALMEQHTTTYYKPTFEPSPKQEEQTAEKVEREKQEEEAKKMEELKVEQKKNEVPLAIRMSRQKAEKYPGASG